MVKKKESPTSSLKMELERINHLNPVIDTKFVVVEVTPAHRYSDEYDDYWIPTKVQIVSPNLETEAEAYAWMDQHDPDAGKYLAVKERVKRKHIYFTWSLSR